MMREEQQLTSLLQSLNWGAFNHPSHALQKWLQLNLLHSSPDPLSLCEGLPSEASLT